MLPQFPAKDDPGLRNLKAIAMRGGDRGAYSTLAFFTSLIKSNVMGS
jgi:hypothetical protein